MLNDFEKRQSLLKDEIQAFRCEYTAKGYDWKTVEKLVNGMFSHRISELIIDYKKNIGQ